MVIPDSSVQKPAGRMAWPTIPHLITLTRATSLVQTCSAQTRWRRARPPEAGTRRRAVVASFALVHPAAGLGRTAAKNLVAGPRTRSCPHDPWSPFRKQSTAIHGDVQHSHTMSKNPAAYKPHLLGEEKDASSRHVSLCTENKALKPEETCKKVCF